MKRRFLSLIGVAGMTAAMVFSVPAMAATMNFSGIPNPAYNVRNTFYTFCSQHGMESTACRTAIVNTINQANRAEGAQAIHLPPDYGRLPATERLFVLLNLERLAFHRTPFAGLNADANAVATIGAQRNTDPFLANRISLGAGTLSLGWGADWATYPTPLTSMFMWVYDDGPGSTNIDCQPGHMTGCWDHRDNILMPWSMGSGTLIPSRNLVAGAADVPVNGHRSITLLQVGTSGPAPLTFTWSQVLRSYSAGQFPVTPFSSAPPRSAYFGRAAGQTGASYWVNYGVRYALPAALVQSTLKGAAASVVTWSKPPMLPVGVPAMVPYPNGTFLRVRNHRAIYWVNHGVLHHVTSLPAFYAAGGHLSDVTAVTSLPASWPLGAPQSATTPSYAQGSLVRFGATPAVYVYDHGVLRHIANPTVLRENGWSWSAVQERPIADQDRTVRGPAVTGLDLNAIATGSLVRVQGHNGLNLVVHGTLRPVSPSLIQQMGGSLAFVQTLPHTIPVGRALG